MKPSLHLSRSSCRRLSTLHSSSVRHGLASAQKQQQQLAFSPSPAIPAQASLSSAQFLGSAVHFRQFVSQSSAPSSPKTQVSMTSLKDALSPTVLEGLREFWFEHFEPNHSLVLPSMSHMKRWFMGGKELDKVCVKRFAPALEAIKASGAKTGQDVLDAVQPTNSLDWLGLIILLDQVPRNCYRGASAHTVFDYFDPIARDVATAAAQRGIVQDSPKIRWRFVYRTWFMMPFEHSEDLAMHDRAVAGFEALSRDVEALIAADASDQDDEYRREAAKVVKAEPEEARKFAELQLEFEMKHKRIVEQFGRYPHRNEAMGREMSKEEADWLEKGGDTFGS